MEKEITIKCEGAIKELGLDILSEEERAEIIEKMTNLVCDKLMLKLISRISDEEIEEANDVMSGTDEKKKADFLAIKMPDFLSVIEEEVNSAKKEISNNIK
ncbi:MAG: DUF5663 domain-containing protein [Candidatus Pacebacteria bacterium]|nr:DUF5663 domain-containing protein [Candidatus Paceibacterota bacterium]MDD4074098.1 DUF5663 domain-containing protein [Candidatus Paceibacterota bacterium]